MARRPSSTVTGDMITPFLRNYRNEFTTCVAGTEIPKAIGFSSSFPIIPPRKKAEWPSRKQQRAGEGRYRTTSNIYFPEKNFERKSGNPGRLLRGSRRNSGPPCD